MNESDFGYYYSAELRIWIENNWGLWRDSTLSQYFRKMGIYHSDDMSGIILTSYYRFLIGEKIKLKKQVKHYQEYWETIRKEKFAKYKVRDTVLYNFKLGYISEKQETESKSNICTVKGVIVSKNEKKNLLKIKLIQDCNNEGIYYLDLKILSKLNIKNLSEDEIRKKVVKIMKIGDEKWFYLEFWELN
jgi:hypothetical protein